MLPIVKLMSYPLLMGKHSACIHGMLFGKLTGLRSLDLGTDGEAPGIALLVTRAIVMPLAPAHVPCCRTRAQDCVQSEGKLYLIFEFVDCDLKKYMEATESMLEPMLVKVNSAVAATFAPLSAALRHPVDTKLAAEVETVFEFQR